MASAQSHVHVNIIDVRKPHSASNGGSDIRMEIVAGLSNPAGRKSLPSMLLYDESGLRLYDDITTKAPEYYLFAAENQILINHASDIVRVMHAQDLGRLTSDEAVVELGAGALRKTSHLLLALSDMVLPTMTDPITYYALDLQERELERTLKGLDQSDVGTNIRGKIATRGLCGTYDDGLKYIQEGGLYDYDSIGRLVSKLSSQCKLEPLIQDPSPSSRSELSSDEIAETTETPASTYLPLHILFLGSSLGNFSRGESAAFLRSLPLHPGDTLLLGLDHDNGPEDIKLAYNDPKGVIRAFIMNGLRSAGTALGDENLFDESKWEYTGNYNEQERRHEAYCKSLTAQTVIDPVSKSKYTFDANELVHIAASHKFSQRDAYRLFSDANLRPIHRWMNSTPRYSLWLLERPPFMFPLLSMPEIKSVVLAGENTTTSYGMPTIEEWQAMWAAWDCITQRMIPSSMLFQEPMGLHHVCLFYLGHIPTFLWTHLSKLLGEPDTESIEFKYMFERGIDHSVDSHSQCHQSHSGLPQRDDWPTVPTILSFQYKVRERVMKLYQDIDASAVVLTRKIARVLFMTLEHEAFHAETLLYMLLQRVGTDTLPPSGFSPPMWSVLAETWDRAPEPKSKTVTLGPATLTLGHDDDEADDASTDVHEFGWDNEHPKREVLVGEFKIEWRPVTNGEFYDYYNDKGTEVTTFPASWVDIDGEIHVRTLYGPVPMKIARHWPITTSFDNLSTYASVKGGRIPTEPELRLFLDMFECGYEGGANIGFRNWHPIPATAGAEEESMKGHNGGVFEWTSTVLEKHDGFIPSCLHPRYSESADSFDREHQVVVGGSYASVPRLAERRTLRNLYHHNDPYAGVGARIAYDA